MQEYSTIQVLCRAEQEQPPRLAARANQAPDGASFSNFICSKLNTMRVHTWMGLVPAATIFMPSAMIAALRMVAVVVPSPAVSLVFEAACSQSTPYITLRSIDDTLQIVLPQLEAIHMCCPAAL